MYYLYKMARNMANCIKELPLSFKRKGIEYVQAIKTDNYYVYKICDTVVYYEVFKRRIVANYTFSKTVSNSVNCIRNGSKVKYPGNEDFGKWAWTARSMDMINEIIKREM